MTAQKFQTGEREREISDSLRGLVYAVSVEFMYFLVTRRQFRSLLCSRDVFRTSVNSLLLILHKRSGPRSVSDFNQRGF